MNRDTVATYRIGTHTIEVDLCWEGEEGALIVGILDTQGACISQGDPHYGDVSKLLETLKEVDRIIGDGGEE
jgi:hypothetical protein|tara:strand:+ start:305 stop:520 length:216 start_codon:yes stop_codon:yes gene_type:complete